MFEYWSFFILTFAGFIGLGLIIYFMGSRKARAEERKYEPYTCGEPFPRVNVGPDNLYQAIKKNLGIEDIQKIHTGKLSDYLLWMLAGFIAVVLMVMML